MRKTLLLTISIVACLVSQADNIRVMSYNIRHGVGMDKVLSLERIAKVIEQWSPDFVAVQEVDSCATRSKGVDQIAELGRQTLMRSTYGAAIPLQGGKYGVALLSKQRPISVRNIAMPSRSEDRTLLVCEFANCVVACTHLSLNEDEHLASADTILREARRWQKPFIIMGDWNSRPDSPFIAQMKEHFKILNDTSQFTFPSDEPKECIDYIAVYQPKGGDMAVKTSYRVVNEPKASDHRPLVADLALKTPASRLMTHKPYLQDPRPDQMTVMFQTDAVCHSWVEYGLDSLTTLRSRTMLDGQEVCYDIENKIVLHNLQPGQRYYYRVCVVGLTHKRAYETHFGDTLKTRFYSFRTPSADGKDFCALVFNDLHQVKAAYDTLLTKVRDTGYDFVIFNGDCLPEPVDRDDAIRMIHNCTDPVGGAEKPVIFVRGNHEIRNYYSAGMHSLIGYRNDLTYGAFSWGDTRFVILDQGEDKPDDQKVYAGLNDFTQLRQDQVSFLQCELNSREFKKASRRVLISHIPIFCNEDKYHPCTQLWGDMLRNKPFDINFCAHTHKLEFFKQGAKGTKFPIMRGGGPEIDRCAVSVLTKRGAKLNLRVVTAKDDYLNIDL